MPPVTKESLLAHAQSHLFEGKSEDDTNALLQEINALTYSGGIERYILQGRKLLGSGSTDSAAPAAADETEIVEVSLPDTSLIVNIPSLSDASNPELVEAAAKGQEALQDNVFVMVAGGLGERLGYSSIKLGLPVETATNTSYLELYLRWAAAAGRNPNWSPANPSGPKQNPFLIMTSDDTHNLTIDLLERRNFFGYDPSSVVLMKQDTVPCLVDNTARIALSKDGKTLIRKPHGHGDVHQLIFGIKSPNGNSLLIDDLSAGTDGEKPYRSITFMQDTNAAATSTAPISVYYLHKNNWVMNFTSVPRMPGEAIGIYCAQKLRNGTQRCGNVEYNLFSPLYTKSSGNASEPLVAEGKYSVFPGSINTLVMNFPAYVAALHKDHGHVPEFINPKYTDATKTGFKSPARIESLMQDIAYCFDFPNQKIGCCTFGRDTFEPVKNALADGVAGVVDKGIAAACAATGEEMWYHLCRDRVAATGVNIHTANAPKTTVVSPADKTKQIEVSLFPIVVYDSKFINFDVAQALTRFPTPSKVTISPRSTLVVKGNVIIKSLTLDGALLIDASQAPEGTIVEVEDLVVSNEGWEAIPIGELEAEASEALTEVDRIRGYVLRKNKTDSRVISEGGKFVLTGGVTSNL
eukprot:GILI01008502.1.p1 GENE.GILI01008502.1~~GILI01008502.1.p1  ORF type:complete len:636 (+),score=185.99 GILI01008502.1:105-2012(+)